MGGDQTAFSSKFTDATERQQMQRKSIIKLIIYKIV